MDLLLELIAKVLILLFLVMGLQKLDLLGDKVVRLRLIYDTQIIVVISSVNLLVLATNL